MKGIIISCMVLILAAGCTSGWKWENVDITPVLNNHNSKVWLINRLIEGKTNKAPLRNIEKNVIIFYASGKYAIYFLQSMGSYPLEKGTYEVDSRAMRLLLETQQGIKRILKMKIETDGIELESFNNSKSKQRIHLIPFPEF
jgi:hypothetical protein